MNIVLVNVPNAPIRVRRVNEEDLLDLLTWRNDVLSRQMSFSDSEISDSDHRIWFNNVIKNNFETILIAENETNKLGMVRLTPKSEISATLSININPKFRQLGFGAEILCMSIEWIKVKSPNLILLKAAVKKENTASLKIFQKNGFTVEEENSSPSENSVNLILRL